MLRVDEYRKEAENLRSLAAKEKNTAVKTKLLDLADQYDLLAAQREEFLELQEEISRAKERPGHR